MWWLAIKAFFGGAWKFLSGLPAWVWYGLAALLVAWAIHHHGVVSGRQEIREKWDAANEAAERAAAKKKVDQAAVSTAVETKYVDRVRVIHERGKTIIKEVPVYVPSDSCPLPGGFRVLHDAAATGVLPDPAAVAHAASVPAQDAAGTVASNYETCLETAERLTRLQEWADKQAKLK